MESHSPQNSLYPQLPNHPTTPAQFQPQHFGSFASPNPYHQQSQQISLFQTPQNNNVIPQPTFQGHEENQESHDATHDATSPLSALKKFFAERDANQPLTFTEKAGIAELLDGVPLAGGNEFGMSREQLDSIGYGYGGTRNQRDESVDQNFEGSRRSEVGRSPSVVSHQSRGGFGMQVSNSNPGFRTSVSLNQINNNNHIPRYGFDFTPTSNAPKPAFFGSSTALNTKNINNSNRINPSRSLNTFAFSFNSNQTIKAQPSTTTAVKSNAPPLRKKPLYFGPGMSGRKFNTYNTNGFKSSGLVRSQSDGAGLVNRGMNSTVNGNRQEVEEEERERDPKRRRNQADGNQDSNASAGFLNRPSDPNAGLPSSSTSSRNRTEFNNQSSINKPSSKRARDESEDAVQSHSQNGSSSTMSQANTAINGSGSEKKAKSRTASAMLDILAKDQNTSLLSKNQQSPNPNGSQSSPQVTKSNLFNSHQANGSAFSFSSTSSNPSTPSKTNLTSSSTGLRKGRLSVTPAAAKLSEKLRLERENKNKAKEKEQEEEEKLRKAREEEREKIRERSEREEEERRKSGLLGRVERSYGAGGRKSSSPSKGSSDKNQSNLLVNNGRDYNQNKPKKPSPLGILSSSTSNSSDLSNSGQEGRKSTSAFGGFGKSAPLNNGEDQEMEDEDEGEVEGELGQDSQTEDEEDDQDQDQDHEYDEEEEEEDQLADDVQNEDGHQEDEEDDDEEVQTPPPPPSKQGSSNQSTFSFNQSQTNASPSKSVAWSDTPIKSAESKPQPKNATPTTPISILSKSKTNTGSTPISSASSTGANALGNPPSTPKEEAKSVPLNSLPSFDISLPQSSSFHDGDELEKQIRLEVKEVGLKSLPSFEFLGDSTNLKSPSVTTEVPKENSKSQPQPFSFTPASTSTSNTTASTSAPLASNGQTETSNPESDDIASSFGSADKGEGEESESTLYETRAAFFSLVNSKWNKLGVGNVKIKKDNETGKQRLLVRHEANKKVIVVSI